MEKSARNKVIAIHAIFWLYEVLLVIIYGDDLRLAIWIYMLFVPLVYLHYFVLVPKIIPQPTLLNLCKWYLVFIILTIIRKQVDYYVAWKFLAPLGWINDGIDYDFHDRLKAAVLLTVANSSGILAVCLGSRFVINQSKSKELESQKAKNELNALKNQIDIPESINILEKLEKKSKEDPASIQDDIIKLTTVLRYHLYFKEGKNKLSKEFEIVQNQLSLYNELNDSNLSVNNTLDDTTIKTGILSKSVGEVLKHTQKVTAELEIIADQDRYFLNVISSNSKYLDALKKRFKNKFIEQINIEKNENSLRIQLN